MIISHKPISVEDAMQVVYDMAKKHFDECDQSKLSYNDLMQQRQALDVAHDFIVNHLGDD